MRCFNCIDEVYMTDLGDGFYRCPVCGDEFDSTYDYPDPFDGDDDFDNYVNLGPEDDDYVYPEFQ